MYAHLHLFHNVAAIVIDQNNQIQENLTQYGIIHEGITDIDIWIEENPYTPLQLYQPSNMERKTYLYALYHCQQIG